MWDKAWEMLHLEIMHHEDRPRQKGAEVLFWKGNPSRENLSECCIFEQIKARAEKCYQHAHKSSCFPFGQEKKKSYGNVPLSAESPPFLALKITCILPLESPNHKQDGRH